MLRRLEDLVNSHKGVVIDRMSSIGGDSYVELNRQRNALVDELVELHSKMSAAQQPTGMELD